MSSLNTHKSSKFIIKLGNVIIHLSNVHSLSKLYSFISWSTTQAFIFHNNNNHSTYNINQEFGHPKKGRRERNNMKQIRIEVKYSSLKARPPTWAQSTTKLDNFLVKGRTCMKNTSKHSRVQKDYSLSMVKV